MVIHLAIVLDLAGWFVKEVDQARCSFIWTGTDRAHGGKCLISRRKLLIPKRNGGLGLKDLKIMGLALRLRWMWLQRTEDKCWSGLPLKHEPAAQAMFDNSITVQLGDGNKAEFWTDRWLDGRKVSELAPNLVRAVAPRTRDTRTAREALQDNAWVDDVEGALTSEVIMKFVTLCNLLETVNLHSDTEDIVRWRWTSSGQYSASSAYSAFFPTLAVFPMAQQLWHSFAPMRCKFFIWLCLHRRAWTADRRLRRGLQTHEQCPLCGAHQDTIDHQLAECAYTRQIWRKFCNWVTYL